jgi:hypothetical protein
MLKLKGKRFMQNNKDEKQMNARVMKWREMLRKGLEAN